MGEKYKTELKMPPCRKSGTMRDIVKSARRGRGRRGVGEGSQPLAGNDVIDRSSITPLIMEDPVYF